MRSNLFDSSILATAQQAVEFVSNILESSTEYSLIGEDLDGKILLWNEGARRLYGYEPEEVVGKANSSILHAPEDVAAGKPRELLDAALRDGKWEGTIRRRRKNGQQFTARVVITPRLDSSRKAIGFLLISKDISDEIRLTEELKATQFYTRSLIESNIDALMTTDPIGIISDVNQQMVSLTGYSREELIGSPFKNFFTDPDRAEDGIRLVLRKGRVTNYELTAKSRDGHTTVVSYNASTFRDAAGKLQGVFAAARDITAQKGMEKQLRDSQSYTRSLIESNIDALMTTDPLGMITDLNQQMEALTGCTREELIGTPFKTYFTDPQRAEQGIRLVLRETRVTNYELTARSKSGRETVVSYNATTFNDQAGKLQGVFAAARDVTERKHFEQTLQEKNVELENASLAKDRFLASMSHELRTPLNAIIGFTGTLLMKLPGPLNTGQEKQLRTIQTSGRHLLSLINDLLDLAKIESGKVELNLESLNCQSIIEDVSATLRALAERKNLKFEMAVPDHELIIRTDRRSFTQILINLTNNAIKFTDKGSVRIELHERRHDGHSLAEIAVVDTGIGIRPNDQARLFQAFIQVDSSSTRAYEGTGLGLHVSQKLAGMIGGRVSFESEYGKGSRFTISVPAVEEVPRLVSS